MTTLHPPFPPPLIIPPLHPPHKQTLILLHGRGSNPSRFGSLLLTTPFTTPITPPSSNPTPTSQTLPTAFPHAKFIFPAAPRRRATIYKRTLTTQWFDSWHLDCPPSDSDSSSSSDNDLLATKPPQRRRASPKNDWLMIDGLRETTTYLHALVREEIALLVAAGGGGARDIVLGGISQGCAASLVAVALWDGEALGGVVGMCGWLPFVEGVIGAMAGGVEGGEDGEEDLFERDGEEKEEQEGKGAVEVLREMLELESTQTPGGVEGMPVFLGHGEEDEAVLLELGRKSAECLGKMGMDVEWREYRGLGHWYSEEMLGDMVGFLKGRLG